MKAIDVSKVPARALYGHGRTGKWAPLVTALQDGKAVVLTAEEVAEYSSETSLRGNISAVARRAGLRVSVRKDPVTGDLYVLPAGRVVMLGAGQSE